MEEWEQTNEAEVRRVIEDTARAGYGRLVAYLSARSRDVASAEDALNDALLSALRHWPQQGVPRKPEAWLLHAARNRLTDAARRQQTHQHAVEELRHLTEEAQVVADEADSFPDERLKLLFVCAHPAIDSGARAPLMLQAVLGVDAARIASAFLVSPAAMGQRLVRAKRKIRDAGITFQAPGMEELPGRISFVLDAIYSAYTAGWESVYDSASTWHALAGDAIALGRTVVQLMPEDAEARGLLALMLHCEARRAARYRRVATISTEPDELVFVPLDEQDPSLWSRPLIAEAEEHLRVAAARNMPGRYQLEAAIQSIHADRAVSGYIDWREISLLYEGLVHLHPNLGAFVGRAVAIAQMGKPAEGFIALEAIPADRVVSYQPYWAAKAHLLQMLHRVEEAQQAYQRAASLTDDAALRRHLLHRADLNNRSSDSSEK